MLPRPPLSLTSDPVPSHLLHHAPDSVNGFALATAIYLAANISGGEWLRISGGAGVLPQRLRPC